MKKLLLLSIAVFVFSFSSSAQTSKGFTYSEQNSIGLRFGYGAEVSYQRIISTGNRIEADLGLVGKGFSLIGNYHWGWTFDEADGLGWYVGPSVGIVVVENRLFADVSGQIGLEYSFDIPLSLSLDWRPSLYIGSPTSFEWTSFALGVRYRF